MQGSRRCCKLLFIVKQILNSAKLEISLIKLGETIILVLNVQLAVTLVPH
jgi:hypothetical protein